MSYEPTTIISEIDKGLKKHDKEVLFSTKRRGEWLETGKKEFRSKVRHFAMGLYELGIRSGDRVSLHSENSTEWLICDQAVLSLGAVTVPIYTTQPSEQIKFILEDAGVETHIISNDELFEQSKSLVMEIPDIERIITIYGTTEGDMLDFEEVLGRGKKKNDDEPELFENLRAKVEAHDLATLIYTSGTTGDPKGVMLSHWNIASNLLASRERVPFEDTVEEGQCMFSYLPLSHVFERLVTYLYISMGYPVYYIEDVDEILDDLAYVQPFYFATIPRLLEKVHTGVKMKGQEMTGLKKKLYYWALGLAEDYDPEHPPTGWGALKHTIADKLVYSQIRERFGSHLLGVVSGGAALSEKLFRFMNAIGLICIQGYGLTETSPVLSVQDALNTKYMRVGSSGPPLSNVEVKVADDGEILTKGPNIMLGYYNDEEKTNEVFTDDGWFKTGDVGKLENGNLFITDRKKSVFKLSTGKYVAPKTIENLLTGSSYIDQAVVLGYKRKFCSAVIVPDYEHVVNKLEKSGKSIGDDRSEDPSVRQLIQQEVDSVNSQLSPWETVKKFILLAEPFTIESGELTPTLKVKRPIVKEHYEEEIDEMYEDEEENTAD